MMDRVDRDLTDPPPARFPVKPGFARPPLSLADLRGYSTIIDARSPAEWLLDRLPGALSHPVLDDAERIRVGTLFKQTSSFEAKKVGGVLVARNIAMHLENAFADKPKNWRPLVYCWRGGSRSGAFTHILRQIGWDAMQLEGGYKRWRAQVVRDLDQLPLSLTFVPICGRTGSGKSRLLDALAARGAQVLDLEGLAAHKGSVLGDLPGQPQPSQKMFESAIWTKLSEFAPERPVFVEAESKKIGALRVPDALLTQMWQGECIELVTPRTLRVPLLTAEYVHLINDPGLLSFKIDCLRALHSTERIDSWHQLVANQAWDSLVAELLDAHYDPAYDRSMFKNYLKIGSARRVALAGIDACGFDDAAGEALSMPLKIL